MRASSRLRMLLALGLALAALAGTPTAAQAQLRIMPLGDSITDGAATPGGYRINLWTYLQWLELDFEFVGSLVNGPAKLGSRNHEGHSGWRIDQIASRIDDWLDTYQPDIVLLHIGTNDCNQNYQFATIGDRLSALIDQITDRAPNTHLVVAMIIPSSNPTVEARIVQYNAQVAEIVSQKAKEGRWVGLLDMHDMGVTLADSLHPNRAGYDTMAAVWFIYLYYAVFGGE